MVAALRTSAKWDPEAQESVVALGVHATQGLEVQEDDHCFDVNVEGGRENERALV